MDPDDVYAPLGRLPFPVVRGEPPEGERAKSCLLGGRHRLLRRAEGIPSSGLDLDEDERAGLPHHEVKLTRGASPVRLQQLVALL